MRYRQLPINEARLQAGLFVSDCLALFGISGRTWYRWCQSGAPPWAYRLLEFRAGHLDSLGWLNWQIRNGKLFCNELSYRYWWEPADLLLNAWDLTPTVMPASLSVAVNDDRAPSSIPAGFGPNHTSHNVYYVKFNACQSKHLDMVGHSKRHYPFDHLLQFTVLSAALLK